MLISLLSPALIEWNKIHAEKMPGERGYLICRKHDEGDVRIRLVEYSENYVADSWCLKGHYFFVSEGSISIELSDNNIYLLEKNTSYIIGDDIIPHRIISEHGATVFIMD
jgi:hypothetical protein